VPAGGGLRWIDSCEQKQPHATREGQGRPGHRLHRSTGLGDEHLHRCLLGWWCLHRGPGDEVARARPAQVSRPAHRWGARSHRFPLPDLKIAPPVVFGGDVGPCHWLPRGRAPLGGVAGPCHTGPDLGGDAGPCHVPDLGGPVQGPDLGGDVGSLATPPLW